MQREENNQNINERTTSKKKRVVFASSMLTSYPWRDLIFHHSFLHFLFDSMINRSTSRQTDRKKN